jgi:hypothetical protein
MPTFPTLSVNASLTGWEEGKAFDPTLRARSEGGYLKTRARTTRVPKLYKIAYEFLNLSDKVTLQAFEDTVKVGSDSFTWLHPIDSVNKTVRLAGPIRYTPMADNKNIWKAELSLEEV